MSYVESTFDRFIDVSICCCFFFFWYLEIFIHYIRQKGLFIGEVFFRFFLNLIWRIRSGSQSCENEDLFDRIACFTCHSKDVFSFSFSFFLCIIHIYGKNHTNLQLPFPPFSHSFPAFPCVPKWQFHSRFTVSAFWHFICKAFIWISICDVSLCP